MSELATLMGEIAADDVRRLFPVTIIMDRYNGGYSGGVWTAWPCAPEMIPEDAQGDDVECGAFWSVEDTARIGRGKTPDEALSDLRERLGR